MQIVAVSPKYRLVIPRAVKESLQLRQGQKMQEYKMWSRVCSQV